MVFRNIEPNPVFDSQGEKISDDFSLRGQQGPVSGFTGLPFGRGIGHQAFQQGHGVWSAQSQDRTMGQQDEIRSHPAHVIRPGPLVIRSHKKRARRQEG